jgi:hypothetical protein
MNPHARVKAVQTRPGLAINSNDGTRRCLVAPWLPRGSGLASAVPHAPRHEPGTVAFSGERFVSSTDDKMMSICFGNAPPGFWHHFWHEKISLDLRGSALSVTTLHLNAWPDATNSELAYGHEFFSILFSIWRCTCSFPHASSDNTQF